MDRNKRVTIFLTAAAIFVVAVIGFAIHIINEVNGAFVNIGKSIHTEIKEVESKDTIMTSPSRDTIQINFPLGE